jgi:lipoic acid synthetase
MIRLPVWLRQEIPAPETLEGMRGLSSGGVNTVCVEANCPNMQSCCRSGKATFMILGTVCTRSCRFCAVSKSRNRPLGLDKSEPQNLARVARDRKITYLVITSVTRDDLDDGGAAQFLSVIEAVRIVCPGIMIEVLIPDFQGKIGSLKTIIEARPDVVGHNLETVSRLYPCLRPEADYSRSLKVLSDLKRLNSAVMTKSSLMLGLSESEEEVVSAMNDLKAHGCDILTLGQYLAPSAAHEPVREFVSPDKFCEYRKAALRIGFKSVLSGPLVRSSYLAERVFKEASLCTM